MIARSYAAPALTDASSAFGIGMRAAAGKRSYLTASLAVYTIASIAFAIAATVTSGRSGDASADEQVWLSAAVVAFATATWTASLRPEPGPTA